MKFKNMKIYLVSLLIIFSQINSLANSYQEEIHDNAQFTKAYTLDDENVVVIISVPGEQKVYETKLDKNGETIYSYIPFNASYSSNAELIVPHSKDGNISDSLLFHHNKQNLPGAEPYDFVTEFNQGKVISHLKDPQSKFYTRKSAVSLKNGKVFLAGITEGTEIAIDAKIYDPETKKFGNGLSFEGIGKFVSCYEQKENQVYCAYVIKQYPFVSKLKLKHLEINPTTNTIIAKGEQVIKTFYTMFNYLKAIPFNEEESIIVFRVGNGELNPPNGNSGKELFYYQLKLSTEETLVTATRYEKLETHCTYRAEEDDSIDIAVLSEHRIYIACEAEEGKLRGYIIYPGKTKIEQFYFNKFDAKEMRNPVFAKFGKSLGIFYTYITEEKNFKVGFHIMNFPDCDDYYKNKIYLLPKYYAKELDFVGRVFMNNPYPASRMKEKISVIFANYSNISIINVDDGNKNIIPGVVYDPETLNLKFISTGFEGIYSIYYKAIRKDDLDGLIEGKYCPIKFNTPECLPQCHSCTKKGTQEENACLGCASERYYITQYQGAISEGYGVPHNCSPCNESCYDCHYKFVLEPSPNTNCKRCDYENGYYHFENDTKICISEETQEYWEGVYNHAFYLDKTPGDKTLWRWKYCHSNCKKCSGPGDDIDNNCDECNEDLYFFCNQTKGHGIPGTCHADCVNNGFFLHESEGFQKCCPCGDECKVCENNYTCSECYKPFYLSPNNDSCVEDCGYCYAKDNTTFKSWQCVNCATRYDVEKYNLNGTCYDEIPAIFHKDPYFKDKYYHVLEKKCNLLIGCKGGCFNCSEWYTEKCTTKCKNGFYRKDYYSLTEQPEIFPCYTERECHGLDKYEFDESQLIGGVSKIINGEGVCYNCRLREGNYRQVENDFTCGPRKARTYISIPEYNKLSACYFRCQTCEGYGSSCKHNCISCRDPSKYCLYKYDEKEPEGNCQTCHMKCGTYPYYHDYDLAEELGLEGDCGQECDVCLYDRVCPKEYPFYNVDTRECTEICAFDEIMSQTCIMNQTESLKNLFDDIEDQTKHQDQNSTEYIATYIKKLIIEQYAANFNIDIKIAEEKINNYLGSGQIFNLQNSQLIIGNNISIEITTNKLEQEKYNNILNNLITEYITRMPQLNTTNQIPSTTTPTTRPTTTPTTTPSTETKSTTPTTTTPTTKPTTTTTTQPTETKSTTSTSTKTETESTTQKTFQKSETKTTTILEITQETTIPTDTPKPENDEEDVVPIVPNLNMTDVSILDISECESVLKQIYHLSVEENILILKGNSIKELEQYFTKDVYYLFYSTSIKKFLDITYCKQTTVKISQSLSAGNFKLPFTAQYKLNSVLENGYDAFDPESDFYNDLCTPFTNENGNDVTLDDRRRDYFIENLNMCDKECTFLGYNTSSNMFSCECPTTKSEDGTEKKEIISKELPSDFYENHTLSNLQVIKCYSQVFSLKGQLTKNIGSYALAACFLSFLGITIFHFVKGNQLINEMFSGIINIKANPPIPVDNSNPDSNRKSVQKTEKEEDIFTGEDLNDANFELAKTDKRSFCSLYWSLLKMKQLFIFTFYTYTDHNLRYIKIALFILFLSFYIAFTALFFNDDIVKKIYKGKGNINIAVHIPNVIFSSLACLIMNLIIKSISLSGKDFIRARKNPNSAEKIKRCIKIKTAILLGVSAALIILFWYYVSAFCSVFKNSQGQYLLNVIAAFIVCNIWPFVTSLIAPSLRLYSIKHDSPCIYKASKIISYI